MTDCDGRQVTSPRKLASIKQVSTPEDRMDLASTRQALEADYVVHLQMLNIHLRGQEVPACNAGKAMHSVKLYQLRLSAVSVSEAVQIWFLQMKQTMHSVW